MQSDEKKVYEKAFGTIIVDECHHVPSETFRNTISKLHSFYLYGLTATPFRKYNDGKVIFIHLGEVIAEIKPEQLGQQQHAKVIIRNTSIDVPFNHKTDQFEVLSRMLINDSTRNKLILEDLTKVLNEGRKAIVITERKEHIEALNLFLKRSYETITLSGDDSESYRNEKWKMLKAGNYQVLITTGQFFGEGSDIQNVECLFLVYPFSFQGKLIQYIGRVQRSEVAPTIYDYRDHKVEYLNKLFLKRNAYYRKLEREVTLFDEHEIDPLKESKVISIKEKIKVPIEQLEFRYGAVGFSFNSELTKVSLDLEVDNPDMRPEFSVLIPYFSRALKLKNVRINIEAEFEDGKLISQLATSADIDRINREVVESVRFRLITREIPGMKPPPTDGLLDLNQLQSAEDKSLYSNEEEFLEEVLKIENYKHYRQVRFLAQKHERTVMKLRFLLTPFSFVFLLAGMEQYHVVMETLDTEEATYIWHLDKLKSSLPSKLKVINEQLIFIRNNGRQVFLENPPENFSRVLHDYSDEKKGFVLWKDMLAERLY